VGKQELGLLLGAMVITSAPYALAADAGPNEADYTDKLQEVVVTATKRRESIDAIPLSVTSVSQAGLDEQGFKSVQDLSAVTPGVVFRNNGTQTDIAIRGVYSSAGAPTTGVYLDDTPLQKRNAGLILTGNGTPLPQLFDLERVEVLRGPQGTLYGGSSEGGTIRLITPSPSLTTYSGYERAEINTVQDGGVGYEAGAAFGGPIIEDKVGFRASVWGQHTGGWVDDMSQSGPSKLASNINSGTNAAARLAVLIAPVDNLTITPSIFFSYEHKNNPDGFLANAPAVTQATSPVAPPGFPALPPYPLVFPALTWLGPYRTINNYYTAGGVETPYQDPSTSSFVVGSIGANYEFGNGVTLHSSTAYSHDETYGYNGASGTDYVTFTVLEPFVPGGGLNGYQDEMHFHNVRNVVSEELRLTSAPNAGRLSWIAGAFFSHATSRIDFDGEFLPSLDDVTQYFAGIPAAFIFGAPGNTPVLFGTNYSEVEAAGFGEGTFAITDKFKATAGVRVSRDTLEFGTNESGLYLGTTTATVANGGLTSGSESATPVTPKASVSYQITPDDLIYLTAAKGFRNGGVNTPPAPIFSSPVSLCAPNLAALGGKPPGTYGSDSLWSYEIGTKLRLIDDRLHIMASVYYIDWSNVQTPVTFPACSYSYVTNVPRATSKGFDIQAELRPIEALTLTANAGYTEARYQSSLLTPTGTLVLIRQGDALPIPVWAGSASATYRVKLTDRFGGYLRADIHRSGSWFATGDPSTAFYNPYTYKQNASTLVNLRLGTTLDGLDLSLFCNNLLENQTNLQISRTVTQPITSEAAFPPRTLGITVTHRF
jgi:iron complex outermembrane receptor protein